MAKLTRPVLRRMIKEALRDDHGGWEYFVSKAQKLTPATRDLIELVQTLKTEDYKGKSKQIDKYINTLKSIIDDIEDKKAFLDKRDKQFKKLTD